MRRGSSNPRHGQKAKNKLRMSEADTVPDSEEDEDESDCQIVSDKEWQQAATTKPQPNRAKVASRGVRSQRVAAKVCMRRLGINRDEADEEPEQKPKRPRRGRAPDPDINMVDAGVAMQDAGVTKVQAFSSQSIDFSHVETTSIPGENIQVSSFGVKPSKSAASEGPSSKPSVSEEPSVKKNEPAVSEEPISSPKSVVSDETRKRVLPDGPVTRAKKQRVEVSEVMADMESELPEMEPASEDVSDAGRKTKDASEVTIRRYPKRQRTNEPERKPEKEAEMEPASEGVSSKRKNKGTPEETVRRSKRQRTNEPEKVEPASEDVSSKGAKRKNKGAAEETVQRSKRQKNNEPEKELVMEPALEDVSSKGTKRNKGAADDTVRRSKRQKTNEPEKEAEMEPALEDLSSKGSKKKNTGAAEDTVQRYSKRQKTNEPEAEPENTPKKQPGTKMSKKRGFEPSEAEHAKPSKKKRGSGDENNPSLSENIEGKAELESETNKRESGDVNATSPKKKPRSNFASPTRRPVGSPKKPASSDGTMVSPSKKHRPLPGTRESLKESPEFKRAQELEWESRNREIEKQRLEVKKKKQVELRQKQRVADVRATQEQEERAANQREEIRARVVARLRALPFSNSMAELLQQLGVQEIFTTEAQVEGAIKKALHRFHPDRAGRGDLESQVEAEEKFKLINEKKKTLRRL